MYKARRHTDRFNYYISHLKTLIYVCTSKRLRRLISEFEYATALQFVTARG